MCVVCVSLRWATTKMPTPSTPHPPAQTFRPPPFKQTCTTRAVSGVSLVREDTYSHCLQPCCGHGNITIASASPKGSRFTKYHKQYIYAALSRYAYMPSTAHSLTTAAGTVQRLPVWSACIEHAELRSPYGGQIMITLTQESFIFRSILFGPNYYDHSVRFCLGSCCCSYLFGSGSVWFIC